MDFTDLNIFVELTVLLQPPIEIRDRLSRQIKPLSCKVPNSDEKGTCMFVFDCNQVGVF